MIIPHYWAECRLQRKEARRQFTVRRFGWSDVSQQEAQSMADARAAEALQSLLRGEKVVRREARESYGGADGTPIREEIVTEEGDAIITRNSYGSLCLNTPDVMFVDMDVDHSPRFRTSCISVMLILVISLAVGVWKRDPAIFLLVSLGALLVLHLALNIMNAVHRRVSANPWDSCRQLAAAFSQKHPHWHLRLYRTPAGFRILVMHALFDPTGEEAAIAFEELSADPVYVQMCNNQRCFRARVSPKPWRAGMARHMRPRPGVWPLKPEQLEVRQQWVKEYESKATAFASCAFVESLGSTAIHPKAEAVRSLHDRLCQAESGLPLA